MAKVQNRYASAHPFGCLFSLQMDDLHKIVGNRFGLRLHIPGDPPFDSFREAAGLGLFLYGLFSGKKEKESL